MAGRKSKSQRSRNQSERRPDQTQSPPKEGSGREIRDSRQLLALIVAATLCGLLAVFQWMELLLAGAGHVSFCAIDEVFNCAAVWDAPWAKWWLSATGVPVAGWGLIWAAVAFTAALWTTRQRLQNEDEATATAAVRLVAVGGVLTVFLLGGYSLSLGQVCLTCLVTYVLVGGYAWLAWGLPSPRVFEGTRYQPAALVMALCSAVIYGLLALFASGTTEVDTVAAKPAVKKKSERAGQPSGDRVSSDVAAYLRSLSSQARSNIAKGLEAYRQATAPPLPTLSARPFAGESSAPVRITDFSDLRCPHCATLAASMEDFVEEIPAEMFRLESRYFPLDGSCNPRLNPQFVDKTGVRCYAPKVLLCSQDSPKYEELRRQLFREQPTLTVERVMELAESLTGRSAASIEACVARPETKQSLLEDIEYAARFDIRGTPMVLLNGRPILAFAPLITAMVLAEGDPNHPGFGQLAAR